MNKSNKIDQLTILISQIQNERNRKNTRAQEWMMKHTKNKYERNIILQLSVVSFHILDKLDDNNELTGAELARMLGVTKGGITRAIKKMKELELVNSVQHIDNKKNIYYKITVKGNTITKFHKQMLRELYEQTRLKIDSEFSEKELDIIIKFLTYIQKHLKDMDVEG